MAQSTAASRILIVEDEAIIAMDLEDSLKSFGYDVVDGVMSGEESLTATERLRPDLVLMDIMLDGKINGITAATQIRDRFNIPVIFVTAHSNDSTIEQAKTATPYGYILKPFEGPELRAAIEIGLHKFKMEKMTKAPPTAPASQSSPAKSAPKKDSKPQAATTSETSKKLAACNTPLEYLSSMSSISSLPESALKALADASRFSDISSGDLISYEGDKDPSSFLVATGRVVMLKTSPNGKQLIVEILLPGDLLSLFIAMQDSPYPLSARAQGKTKVLLIDKATLGNVLKENPQLYHEIAENLSARLRFAHDLSRGLAHDRVEVRIATTLSALAPQMGSSVRNGEATLIEITRQELADLTGTSPETAIRITKAMEREGLLGLEKPGQIQILDLDGLQDMIESG